MPTIVCQNIMSHFESQTATLKLKVAPPPPPPEKLSSDHEFGNWGFLQTNPNEKDGFYTPQKPSFSRLSPISLELCTENLGSETGSENIIDSSIFSNSLLSIKSHENSCENDVTCTKNSFIIDDSIQKNRNTHHEAENNSCRRNKTSFPPPLTSMSGSSSLQVRRHREGGRLIIEAVEAPFRNSFLQAERCDGRLKLCFLTSASETAVKNENLNENENYSEMTAAETAVKSENLNENENYNEMTAVSTAVRNENLNENENYCEMTAAVIAVNNSEKGNENKYDSEMVAKEEIEGPTSEDESSSDEELINEEINSEIGIEKFQWMGRCMEGGHGNKGLCSNWKPALWVATS